MREEKDVRWRGIDFLGLGKVVDGFEGGSGVLDYVGGEGLFGDEGFEGFSDL